MFTLKTFPREPWLSFAEAVELSGSVLLGVYQAQTHVSPNFRAHEFSRRFYRHLSL